MPKETHPQSEPLFNVSEASEIRPPLTLKDKFSTSYYNAVPYFSLNLIWFALSLPVITIFPAQGGLYYAVLQMTQEGRADAGTVWEGFKKYWWLSLRWGLLVYGVEALLLANIWFYEKKIFLAIRNGLVVVMRKPLAALKVMVFSLLILAVSLVLPPLLVFIAMAWIISIRTRTVIKVLKSLESPDENPKKKEKLS